MSTRAYTLPVLTLFVLTALFGVFTFVTPMHDEIGCPFMPSTSVACSATFLEYWNHWQTAFATILIQTFTLFALTLLAWCALAARRWRQKIPKPQFVCADQRSRQNTSLRMFNDLKEAFSDGILNPKIF